MHNKKIIVYLHLTTNAEKHFSMLQRTINGKR